MKTTIFSFFLFPFLFDETSLGSWNSTIKWCWAEPGKILPSATPGRHCMKVEKYPLFCSATVIWAKINVGKSCRTEKDFLTAQGLLKLVSSRHWWCHQSSGCRKSREKNDALSLQPQYVPQRFWICLQWRLIVSVYYHCIYFLQAKCKCFT